MLSRWMRVLICMLLVCSLVFNFSPIRAMAVGGVVGGIIGSSGLGLSMGGVASLLLASLGAVFGAAATYDLGTNFEEYLDLTVQAEQAKYETNAAMQDEVSRLMEEWIASAKAGYIQLETGTEWIVSAVKEWAAGFISGTSFISVPGVDASGNILPIWGSSVSAGSVVNVGRLAPNYSDSSFCVNNTDYQLYRAYSLSKNSVSYVGTLYYVIIAPGDIQFDCTLTGSAKLTQYSSDYLISVGDQLYSWANITFAFSRSSVTSEWKSATQGAFVIRDSTQSIEYKSEYEPYGSLQAAILGGTIVSPDDAVSVKYPDTIIGGIADQITQGVAMDVIGLPDISIPGADVLPVNPSETQTEAEAITEYLLAALLSGTITWEQYWELIGVYSPTIGTSVPTISIPNADPSLPPENFELTDNGVSANPVSPSTALPFMLDLKDFFPFCIPFDLYEFFSLLCAEPTAPVFHWEIQDLAGNPYSIDIDLSAWDGFATLFRYMELLVFIIGLAMASRKFIKW